MKGKDNYKRTLEERLQESNVRESNGQRICPIPSTFSTRLTSQSLDALLDWRLMTFYQLSLLDWVETITEFVKTLELQNQSQVFRAFLHIGAGNLLKSCACKHCLTSNT